MAHQIIKTHVGHAVVDDAGETIAHATRLADAQAIAEAGDYHDALPEEPTLPGLLPLFDRIQHNKEYAL